MLKFFLKIFSRIKISSKLIIDLLFLGWKTIRIILGFGSCKFIPTCSEYSLIAIKKYGVIKGVYLSAKRILRCNPFTDGGYDPIP